MVTEWTNPPAIQFTQQLDAQFEKLHPGVKVELEDAPTADNAYTTLTTSELEAKSVDVLAQYAPTPAGFPPADTGLKTSGTAALITSNQLTNLTNEPFMKNYSMTEQKWAMGYKGQIYGVHAASYTSGGGLWYKPALLAKYHLALPTTFSQFIADCKTLKADGITPIFVAGKDDLQSNAFNGILAQLEMQGHPSSQGAQVANQYAQSFWNGTKNWNSAIYQKTAQEYEQVMSYIEPGAGGVSQLTAPGVWAAQAENYPFFFDGSWDGHTIQQANPKLSFGFFTLPGTNDPAANRATYYADLSWVVPVWAKQKTLAMEWLALFSEPSNYKKWLQVTGASSTEPGLQAQGLPWMSWLNSHAASDIENPLLTWVPTGAAPDASGPDLTKMVPFGSESISAALNSAASDYTKARSLK